MENKIKNMGENGVITVADFITDTKIRFKYSISKTLGGMYILEEQSMELESGEVDTEIINTWNFEEVKKWCMRAIIHKSSIS